MYAKRIRLCHVLGNFSILSFFNMRFWSMLYHLLGGCVKNIPNFSKSQTIVSTVKLLYPTVGNEPKRLLEEKCYAIWDTGAQKSMINLDLARKYKLPLINDDVRIVTLNGHLQTQEFQCGLSFLDGTYLTASLPELRGVVTSSVVRKNPFHADAITFIPRHSEPKEFYS